MTEVAYGYQPLLVFTNQATYALESGEGEVLVLPEHFDPFIVWVPLRAESNQPSIRRTSSSFRYHRVQLTGSVADCLAITHFDVEFYNKFVHSLR